MIRAFVHLAQRPLALSLALAVSGLAVGCSLLNQDGPTVTCQDLQCGRINACEDGIIAQCSDGVTLKYHACQLADACEQTWQVEGAFRCAVEETDCEGCRPERTGCDAFSTGATTSADASSSSADASSSDASSSSADASSGSATGASSGSASASATGSSSSGI